MNDLEEARALARALLAAFQEICDDLGDLTRTDPSLDYDLLPEWLTRRAGTPERWERGDGNEDPEDLL